MRFLILFVCLASVAFASVYKGRDPFKPVDLKGVSLLNKTLPQIAPTVNGVLVKVTGIIWDENDPMAVVLYSGKRHIVGLSDRFLGYDVISISKKELKLKGDTKTFILKVGKESQL